MEGGNWNTYPVNIARIIYVYKDNVDVCVLYIIYRVILPLRLFRLKPRVANFNGRNEIANFTYVN